LCAGSRRVLRGKKHGATDNMLLREFGGVVSLFGARRLLYLLLLARLVHRQLRVPFDSSASLRHCFSALPANTVLINTLSPAILPPEHPFEQLHISHPPNSDFINDDYITTHSHTHNHDPPNHCPHRASSPLDYVPPGLLFRVRRREVSGVCAAADAESDY
jgi:hypothetical protein